MEEYEDFIKVIRKSLFLLLFIASLVLIEIRSNVFEHMDSFSRYISISKVCQRRSRFFVLNQFFAYRKEQFVSTTMKCNYIKHLKRQPKVVKFRDLWITDFVLMPNVNKVAVAYTSKELSKMISFINEINR